MIGAVYAAGLGLPDRDYYLADDASRQENRVKYVEHLAAMFRLLNESNAKAKSSAATVMRIETALAGASLTRVERRDPHKIYHPKSLDELKTTARKKGFDLKITVLETPEMAQRAPSGYGVYNLLYNGKVLADHYISNTRFANILEKERS
jgi:predicted metalloendopeptidase